MLNGAPAGAVERNPYCIALSGGRTPAILFRLMASSELCKAVNWEHVHFFWSDERCVGPDHPDSNFGMANRELLTKIAAPKTNIHRILGENDPNEEADRYAGEINKVVASAPNGIPRFDLVLLGVGDDGHTASLFPGIGDDDDLVSICHVAFHPVTRQKRISFTLNLINNAIKVRFLVCGRDKAPVIAEILNRKTGYLKYPAGKVDPFTGDNIWYLDREAAIGI